MLSRFVLAELVLSCPITWLHELVASHADRGIGTFIFLRTSSGLSGNLLEPSRDLLETSRTLWTFFEGTPGGPGNPGKQYETVRQGEF